MADEKQNQFALLALVGIVAVVGIVGLTFMVVGGGNERVVTATLPASAIPAGGNLAGESMLLNCGSSGHNAILDGFVNGWYDEQDVFAYWDRCDPGTFEDNALLDNAVTGERN